MPSEGRDPPHRQAALGYVASMILSEAFEHSASSLALAAHLRGGRAREWIHAVPDLVTSVELMEEGRADVSRHEVWQERANTAAQMRMSPWTSAVYKWWPL